LRRSEERGLERGGEKRRIGEAAFERTSRGKKRKMK
tara:strand:+ start:1410 stop:1517 length:108 start_codon:yes stop_codon:yes gene_type:complete